MLFNTYQFVIFFIAVFLAYYALPHRARWILLFFASYYFYMCWNPAYIVLIVFVTLVNWLASLVIDHSRRASVRITSLVAALSISFGLLVFYKYTNFILKSVNLGLEKLRVPSRLGMLESYVNHWIASWNGFVGTSNPAWELDPVAKIILPVGISFFTFQCLSYTIDVFLRRLPAEKNPFVFATYVAFFPQLVAGPIERADNLLPQITAYHPFRHENIRMGLRFILWGLYKKIVVADTLSAVVNSVYRAPEEHTGPLLCLATLFFAIQIYCDFSGYSDIAIGVARVFGFQLMTNFRQPYFARSIAEFWQRWHISLTTWFRDYVYIPLGGNRVGPAKWAFNVFIVFLLSGIWHGAEWTFIVWGVLHSLYFFLQRLVQNPLARVTNSLQLHRVPLLLPLLEWATVMLCVLIGWVYFRAESVAKANDILLRSLDWRGFTTAELFRVGLPRFEMFMAFAWIGILMFVDGCLTHRPKVVMKLWENRAFRWTLYVIAFYTIVFFGVFEKVDFIYFQF